MKKGHNLKNQSVGHHVASPAKTIEFLHGEIQQMESDGMELAQQNAALKIQMSSRDARWKMEKQAMQEQIDSAKQGQAFDTGRAIQTELEDELKELKLVLKDKEKYICKLSSRPRNDQFEIERVKRELSDKCSQIKAMELSFDKKMKHIIAEKDAVKSDLERQLSAENSALANENTALKKQAAENTALAAENAALAAQNTALAAENAALAAVKKDLERQLTAENSALANANTALKKQAAQNTALAAENAALAAVKKDLERQLTAENSALVKENTALKKQAAQNTAVAAVKIDLERQLTAENSALSKENTALKKQAAQNAAVAAQNTAVAAENAALAAVKRDLERQLTAENSALGKENTALKKQAAENTAVAAENAALAAQNAALAAVKFAGLQENYEEKLSVLEEASFEQSEDLSNKICCTEEKLSPEHKEAKPLILKNIELQELTFETDSDKVKVINEKKEKKEKKKQEKKEQVEREKEEKEEGEELKKREKKEKKEKKKQEKKEQLERKKKEKEEKGEGRLSWKIFACFHFKRRSSS